MPREAARAGWHRITETYLCNFATGVLADVFFGDSANGILSFGHQRVIDKVQAFVVVVGAGAGASRVLTLQKWRTAPSGAVIGSPVVIAQATITLAGTATKGTAIAVPLVAQLSDRLIGDTELLGLQVDAGGTQFTALSLEVQIISRQRPQRLA